MISITYTGKIFELVDPINNKSMTGLALSEPDQTDKIEFVFINSVDVSTEGKTFPLPDGILTFQAVINIDIIMKLKKEMIVKEISVLNQDLVEKILRTMLLNQAERYYDAVYKPKRTVDFVENKTRIQYAGRVFDAAEINYIINSSIDFWLTYGRYSKKFETKLAKYLGVKHALFVNSGSSANLLAFSALTSHLLKDRQVKRGDEIITVASGFPTTISPIVQYGAVPVFIDIDIETLNANVDQLEMALSSKSKAVMLAHTLGNPFNINAVKTFCEKNNLWLIEDNCDALGSTYAGKITGTWGDIGTSSFYPAHHITTGEGGAVYTDNPILNKIMLSIRDWGRDCWCDSGKDNSCGKRFSGQFGTLPFGYDHKYVYSHFGYNLKATDIQAAIGCAQLDKLPEFIQKRKANYQYLYKRLIDFDKYFILSKATPDSDPSWFGFLMTLKDNLNFKRNDIVNYLESHHIQTRNLFAGNIVKHPCFDALQNGIDYRIIGNLSNSDKVMNDSFWIGVYPGMNKESMDYMINMIQEFIRMK